MDSILYKLLNNFGIKERVSRGRDADRCYDHGYDVQRKKSYSTESSMSDDDDTDYSIEKSASTVEKVEDLMSQMFEACAANMKGMFDDSSSPQSSEGDSRRRLKRGSGYNATTTPSRSDNNKNTRASKSSFNGTNQRKRGTRTPIRKYRSISRTPRRKQLQNDTLLQRNKMTLIVRNDDDDVSALSAGTLEEMANRQQRLILLKEANYLRSIHPGGVENNIEDLKSTNSFSTVTTSDFEGTWSKNRTSSTTRATENVGLYETNYAIPEEGAINSNSKSIAEEDKLQSQGKFDTPLYRKLMRHQQVNSALQFKTIDEDKRSTFSLRSNEEEI